jgi:hypothetical protein
VNGLEVDDGGGPADVEDVAAYAPLASTTSLLAAYVSEAVFDRHAITQSCAALETGDELS